MRVGRGDLAMAGIVALVLGCNGAPNPNGQPATGAAVTGGTAATTSGGTTGATTSSTIAITSSKTTGGTTGGTTTSGATTGGTTAAVAWLHVANQTGDSITTFGIDGTGKPFSPADTALPAGFAPYALATDPSGGTLFATGVGTNQLVAIAIKGSTLTPGTPVATSRPTPVAVCASSGQVFCADLDVTSAGAGTSGAYDAFAWTGTTITAPGAGATIGVLGGPSSVVLDSGAGVLYVGDYADGEVLTVPLHGTIGGAVVANGNGAKAGPIALAIAPNGKMLFSGNGDGTITPFTITPFTVAYPHLTPGTPVPASTNGGALPMGLAVDATGTYLASANGGPIAGVANTSGSDDVAVFSIGTAGLTALGAPSKKTGAAPGNVIFHPTAAVLYAANTGDDTVSTFQVSAQGLASLGVAALPTNDHVPLGLAVSK